MRAIQLLLVAFIIGVALGLDNGVLPSEFALLEIPLMAGLAVASYRIIRDLDRKYWRQGDFYRKDTTPRYKPHKTSKPKVKKYIVKDLKYRDGLSNKLSKSLKAVSNR